MASEGEKKPGSHCSHSVDGSLSVSALPRLHDAQDVAPSDDDLPTEQARQSVFMSSSWSYSPAKHSGLQVGNAVTTMSATNWEVVVGGRTVVVAESTSSECTELSVPKFQDTPPACDVHPEAGREDGNPPWRQGDWFSTATYIVDRAFVVMEMLVPYAIAPCGCRMKFPPLM